MARAFCSLLPSIRKSLVVTLRSSQDSRLLKDRIVVLWGGVNDQMAASIIGQLLFLQMDNATKPIHMYINSPGGVVTAGLAIYDTMMSLNNSLEIHTTVLGQAASMGSVLATAGTPGCRHAMPKEKA